MKKRGLLWGLPTIIWLLFTFWYTDFGGPMTQEEIARGMAFMKSRNYNPELLVQVEAFLQNDTGRQFLMVNNIDINAAPPPMPGFSSKATAEDYLDHYMEHMYPQLFKRACHPIFYGTGLDFVADISGVTGTAVSGWDTAALIRYRSRRSFLEIISHPDMQDRHDYKLAAMVKTIASPVEPDLYVSDLRFILLLLLGFGTAIADILMFGRRQ